MRSGAYESDHEPLTFPVVQRMVLLPHLRRSAPSGRITGSGLHPQDRRCSLGFRLRIDRSATQLCTPPVAAPLSSDDLLTCGYATLLAWRAKGHVGNALPDLAHERSGASQSAKSESAAACGWICPCAMRWWRGIRTGSIDERVIRGGQRKRRLGEAVARGE